MTKPTIYIIGAGISGLTSALLLSDKGYKVRLYESTRTAGGRLRSFMDESLGLAIDNGNHLILGANKSTINLLERLNLINRFNKFTGGKFSFLDMETKGGFETDKLNLSRIPDINAGDYLKLLKLLLPVNQTVAEAFKSEGALFKNFVDHISRSMLNTSSYTASAKMLRNLFAKIAITPDALDYYYPKENWADALINPIIEKLKSRNVEIIYNKSLKRFFFANGKVTELIFSDSSEIIQPHEHVILATPSWAASNLIDGLTVPQKQNPILNIHFKYDHDLKPQIFALLNSPIDWVFIKPGLISTTTSDASEELIKTPEAELAKKAWADIAEYLNLQKVKQPHFRIITEKRATFSSDAKTLKQRPANHTEYKNLLLAGDYTSSYLPATIEAAIRAAEKCATIISK